MEISSNKATSSAAWDFYSQEQQLLAQLNQAVGNAGNPDVDPNDTATQQTS